MGFLKKLFGDYSAKEVKRVLPLRDKVLALEETYAAKTDEELQAVTPALRERLANGERLTISCRMRLPPAGRLHGAYWG